MADYNVREERSNAGATALATSFLTNVFGLTSQMATRVMDTIQSNGEMPALRQSIKLMPVSSHTRLNQMIGAGETSGIEDTPFDDTDMEDGQSDEMGSNDDFDINTDPSMVDASDSVDNNIDGEVDTSNDSVDMGDGELDDNIDSGAVDSSDYDEDSRKDQFREGKTSFASFRENAMLNAKLDSAISSNADSEFDQATLKKIKNLEAKGQKDAANNMRKQASRKNQAAQGGKMRPTQRRVLAKKKELARAIQADKEAQTKEEVGNEQF